jgi:hypothetical protein
LGRFGNTIEMQLAGMAPRRRAVVWRHRVHVRTSSSRSGDSDERIRRAAYVHFAPDFAQLRHALANRKSCRNLLFQLIIQSTVCVQSKLFRRVGLCFNENSRPQPVPRNPGHEDAFFLLSVSESVLCLNLRRSRQGRVWGVTTDDNMVAATPKDRVRWGGG